MSIFMLRCCQKATCARSGPAGYHTWAYQPEALRRRLERAFERGLRAA
jgi:hypothetical protein